MVMEVFSVGVSPLALPPPFMIAPLRCAARCRQLQPRRKPSLPYPHFLFQFQCHSNWLSSSTRFFDSMVPVGSSNLSYCSITNAGKSLYSYTDGDLRAERLAALCLETAPRHHRWYSQTAAGTTVGFLFDEGYVYFAIVKDSVCNSAILEFLHQMRDDFRRTPSVPRSLSLQQRVLHPHPAAALDKVSSLPSHLRRLDVSYCKRRIELGVFSMEAPLLGKLQKSEERSCSSSCSKSSESGEGEVKSEVGALEMEGGFVPAMKARASSRRCGLVGVILAVEAAVGAAVVIVWLLHAVGYRAFRD